MTQQYRNASFQKTYDALLLAAADKNSELYYNGLQHRGASHRCAFWDGFSGKFTLTGPNRSANVVPNTLTAVAFRAGREWARRCAPVPKPVAMRNGLLKIVQTDWVAGDNGKRYGPYAQIALKALNPDADFNEDGYLTNV